MLCLTYPTEMQSSSVCLVLNYITPSCSHSVKITNISALNLTFLDSSLHIKLLEVYGNLKISNLKIQFLNLFIL